MLKGEGVMVRPAVSEAEVLNSVLTMAILPVDGEVKKISLSSITFLIFRSAQISKVLASFEI